MTRNATSQSRRRTTRRTRLVADLLITMIAAGGIYVASATSLGSTLSSAVAADTTALVSCDNDGVTTNLVFDEHSTNVVGIDVGGTNADCAGWTLDVTLEAPTGETLSAGSAPVPPGGTPVTVPMTATPPSEIAAIAVVISSV